MKRGSLTLALLAMFALGGAISEALAGGSGTPTWALHWTGCQTSTPVSAMAMRDGAWPVVFASRNERFLEAWSLFPMTNPQTGTSWFPIGFLPNTPGPRIEAASSPDGRFAVLAETPDGWSSGQLAVGSSPTGLALTAQGVSGMDFDTAGQLVTLTQGTVPGQHRALVDIAAGSPGTVAVVDNQGMYYQKSPWLSGQWFPTDLRSKSWVIQNNPADLDLAVELDAQDRPHVIGSAGYDVFAVDFDIRTGLWSTTVLGYTQDGSSLPVVATAVDSQGGVGVTWNEGGLLRYAYKDGTAPWATTTVASEAITVTTPFGPNQTYQIDFWQRPGLTFDADDNPVISFFAGGGNLCVAYDPVLPTPEPASLVMLTFGAGTLWCLRRKTKTARTSA